MNILNEDQGNNQKSGWNLEDIDRILEEPNDPEADENADNSEECPNCGAPWDNAIGCTRCSLSPEDLS